MIRHKNGITEVRIEGGALLALMAFFVILILSAVVWRFEMHKHALERIAGHSVSNWDAFWTSGQ